jgi:hypothetical protein
MASARIDTKENIETVNADNVDAQGEGGGG